MNEVIRLCMLIFFFSYRRILFHRRGGFVNAAKSLRLSITRRFIS